jgi:hypothetical protein
MVRNHPTGSNGHQPMAPPVKSRSSAPGPRHASSNTRNVIRETAKNCYTLCGLDKARIHVQGHRMSQLQTKQQQLRRIVLLTADLSVIGGIQTRTRNTLANASGRDVDYLGVSITSKGGSSNIDRHFVYSHEAKQVLYQLSQFSPTDTVIVITNNVLKLVKNDPLFDIVSRFPLLFFGSAQLAFFLQNSPVLTDFDYISRLKVQCHCNLRT